MEVIKMNATDSTNAYLKRLVAKKPAGDGTVVWAEWQEAGRGQRDAVWQSEAGKNLTFSLLKTSLHVSSQDQFGLNMAVSMGITRALEGCDIPDIRIKWPNDILSGRRKICGILIENILQGAYIRKSIIGVGLNVNQEEFEGLPRAASLKMITGRRFDREELLEKLRDAVLEEIERLTRVGAEAYRKPYQSLLFGKDQNHRFRRPGGEAFRGAIRGVDPDGKLRLTSEAGKPLTFGFKEIEMLY